MLFHRRGLLRLWLGCSLQYVPILYIMIIFDIFSMDGHHLAFYMTEHYYSVFCNQKQGSTNANLSGNLFIWSYIIFFLARFARSVFKTLIKCIVQSGTSTKSMHHIVLPY